MREPNRTMSLTSLRILLYILFLNVIREAPFEKASQAKLTLQPQGTMIISFFLMTFSYSDFMTIVRSVVQLTWADYLMGLSAVRWLCSITESTS